MIQQEKQLVQLCRQLIENSLQWGDSRHWKNQDFEILSEKILEKTQVQLSVSTLKRIWGKVNYESSPNITTLNALVNFLGFRNWHDFRQQHLISGMKANETMPVLLSWLPKFKELFRRFKLNKRIPERIVPVISLLAALFGISFFSIKMNDTTIEDGQHLVEFTSKKTSDDLPNSVIFTYDASSFNSDDVFIQQSWDPGRRERVSASGKKHTSIYYYPGHFRAKLVVDGKIKKEDKVFIKTKGWKGVIEKKPVPIYLRPNETKGKKSLKVTQKTLIEKLGVPVFNDIWVSFYNVRNFEGLKSDHFTLEAKLRNSSSVEESLCRKVKVSILGTDGATLIPLADKGCISAIDLWTGEYWVYGKENDLSAFGCDFSNFQDLKCQVENHRLAIYLNNKLIFSTQQKQSIGEIIGLRFSFEGMGEIKEVKLNGPQKVVYEEHF